MLGQRRRRWTNIKSVLVQRLVLAGSLPSKHEKFSHFIFIFSIFNNIARTRVQHQASLKPDKNGPKINIIVCGRCSFKQII